MGDAARVIPCLAVTLLHVQDNAVSLGQVIVEIQKSTATVIAALITEKVLFGAE